MIEELRFVGFGSYILRLKRINLKFKFKIELRSKIILEFYSSF